MKNTAKKKNMRNIRTKIRFTKDELLRLREIAQKHNMTEAALLRAATLEESFDRLAVTKRDDLQELASIVSGLDEAAAGILACADKAGLAFMPEIQVIDGNGKEIDRLYAVLRKKIENKRNLVARKAAWLLMRQTGRKAREYREAEGVKTEHAMSLCVSEDEIEIIRSAAGREGCSISCLLKTNAFNRFACGRIVADADSLDSFLAHARQKQRFLNAILSEARTRRMEDDDLSSIVSILKEARDEFQRQADRIDTSADAVRREARELLKQAQDGG